jgi:alanine racemase
VNLNHVTKMRPTYLEVNLAQLKKNLDKIRVHVAPAKVLVVLKANAYGHGVDGVAPFIAPYADYIGVALVEEAIHLRKLGITTPILVMGGTLSDQLPEYFEYDLTLAASSLDLLTSAQEMAEIKHQRLKVHLKIDTGMERIGVHEYEAEPFIEKSLACSQLEIEGIFTHFANSENEMNTNSHLQLERFQEVLSIYEKRGAPHPPLRHTANSGATLLFPESFYDMVRPGVLFYGVYPARDIKRNIDVKPALTWKSRVVYSKITQPGRPVSYGSLWQTESPARIVTIPCGYADGYFRRMTNQAQVLINGKKYPQVGRICMDQFMVNAGENDIKVGDQVTLLGDQISAEELADWSGTNEYEVMTNISGRVPRVFVTE